MALSMQIGGARRGVSAYKEALPYGALVGAYLRAQRPHTATVARFAVGKVFCEIQPELPPVLVRVVRVYGRGGKETACIAKSPFRSWLLREVDVRLEDVTAALRELKALIGSPAGRRVAMASRTRIVGVSATAIEVDLRRLAFLSVGMTLAQVQAAATQLGEHLHVALAGGGDLYIANTVLAEVEADNLL